MYKHDFHRVAFGHQTIVAHPLEEKSTKYVCAGYPVEPPQIPDDVKEDYSALFQKVVNKLVSRGARGIQGIGCSFRVMDKDRSGQLSMQEMYRAMKDYRVSNDEREVKAIFDFFDIDLNGKVSYDEFLRAIVGEMNDNRKEVCIRAFNVID